MLLIPTYFQAEFPPFYWPFLSQSSYIIAMSTGTTCLLAYGFVKLGRISTSPVSKYTEEKKSVRMLNMMGEEEEPFSHLYLQNEKQQQQDFYRIQKL